MFRRRIAVVILAITALIGGVATAAPAQAGNGKSSYLLDGKCTDSGYDGWIFLAVSNYPSGASAQIYHTDAYGAEFTDNAGVRKKTSVEGVYLNGVKKGTAKELFIKAAGHGRNWIKVVGIARNARTGAFLDRYQCSVYL